MLHKKKTRGSEVPRAGVCQSLFQVTTISKACKLDIHGLASEITQSIQLLTRRVHHPDDKRLAKDRMREIGRYPHATVS